MCVWPLNLSWLQGGSESAICTSQCQEPLDNESTKNPWKNYHLAIGILIKKMDNIDMENFRMDFLTFKVLGDKNMVNWDLNKPCSWDFFNYFKLLFFTF